MKSVFSRGLCKEVLSVSEGQQTKAWWDCTENDAENHVSRRTQNLYD